MEIAMEQMEQHFTKLRQNMVETQLKTRGIKDKRVLYAFKKVPRHLFVTPEKRHQAYEDHPLPIGLNQTISQPYIVALMTQSLQLKGDERVLEIGTGSGYQAAILAELAEHVYTVERFEELSQYASSLLKELGYDNVSVKTGDGSKGWPEKAPFQGIIVTAAASRIPPALLDQLSPNGKLVVPVGDYLAQELLRISKDEEGRIIKEESGGCRFVPLIEDEKSE